MASEENKRSLEESMEQSLRISHMNAAGDHPQPMESDNTSEEVSNLITLVDNGVADDPTIESNLAEESETQTLPEKMQILHSNHTVKNPEPKPQDSQPKPNETPKPQNSNPSAQPKPSDANRSRTETSIELGYVEDIDAQDKFRVETHHYFVQGKVGGRPAWLSFTPLPKKEQVKCGVCKKPMCFLLQVYAPVEGKSEDCFHRSIFVFLCKNAECSQQNSAANFAVFRSQLPRLNEFYSDKPLDEDMPLPADAKRAENYNSLCFVCGCLGELRCKRCTKVTYCSSDHQLTHWHAGHKKECKQGMQEEINMDTDCKFTFPELEMVTETEVLTEKDEDKKSERSEGDRMADYRRFLEKQAKSNSNFAAAPADFEMMEDIGSVKKEDKMFQKFQRRVEQNPEQIIRYQRQGEPLWATDHTPQDAEVPNCERCGHPRTFEFQIMPYLLSVLSVDALGASIDWATVAVYTCAESCDLKGEYAAEFLWKQDFVE